jgi:hypothetical protein
MNSPFYLSEQFSTKMICINHWSRIFYNQQVNNFIYYLIAILLQESYSQNQWVASYRYVLTTKTAVVGFPCGQKRACWLTFILLLYLGLSKPLVVKLFGFIQKMNDKSQGFRASRNFDLVWGLYRVRFSGRG